MTLLSSLEGLSSFPGRIVSLVPSMTASLFDLGLGGNLVGISDYCTYPAGSLLGLERVGGPKTIHIERILALEPDLIIANQEENARAAVEQLAEKRLLWLTFPKSVRQGLEDLWQLARLSHDEMVYARVRSLETAVEYAELALHESSHQRVFVPIWRGETRNTPWWMTVNDQTYMADVIRLLGGVNVFASRERKYPLEAEFGWVKSEPAGDRDTRYPRVGAQEVLDAAPDAIILPDDPYPFSEEEIQSMRAIFSNTPAVKKGRIYRVDGRLLAWHGTFIGKALNELANLLRYEDS